jgi:hypothetical protein
MKLAASGLILASMFSPGLTESGRVKILMEHFDPPIGSKISVQLDSIPENQRKTHPELLLGSIIVTPPKGSCFTITQQLDRPDLVICEKKTVMFKVADINPDGQLIWQISTGSGDVSTSISWPSDMVRGKVVDLTMDWPGPSRIILISSCDAQHTFEYGRRIFLRLLSGERWIIALPKEDTLIGQPVTASNLFIGVDGAKKKGVVVDEIPDSTTSLAVGLVYPEQKKLQKSGKWVATWQMHPRGAFKMSADGFIPNGSQTPGMHGKCLYKYSGHPDNLENGLIECHDVQQFRWVSLPLTCLGELKSD